MPITVVVKKSTTGAEGRALFEQTGLRCDIRKGAVTIVPIQAVLAEVCDEEIFVAVVVVVSDANAVGPRGVVQACLFGQRDRSGRRGGDSAPPADDGPP